jgi:hypothetical protein
VNIQRISIEACEVWIIVNSESIFRVGPKICKVPGVEPAHHKALEKCRKISLLWLQETSENPEKQKKQLTDAYYEILAPREATELGASSAW